MPWRPGCRAIPRGAPKRPKWRATKFAGDLHLQVAQICASTCSSHYFCTQSTLPPPAQRATHRSARSARAGVHSGSAPSPCPSAHAHAERLLALGLEARARSGRATPRGLQGVVGARAQTGFSAAASFAQLLVEGSMSRFHLDNLGMSRFLERLVNCSILLA